MPRVGGSSVLKLEDQGSQSAVNSPHAQDRERPSKNTHTYPVTPCQHLYARLGLFVSLGRKNEGPHC
jgi:hypothetical protein